MTARLRATFLLVSIGVAHAAGAQPWNVDARTVARGGIAAWPTLTTSPGERTIALPLGVVQVVADYKVFLPSSSDFDPFRVAQYVSDPLHVDLGRGGASGSFMHDLRVGMLNPDLLVYRGFASPPTSSARLINPKWGRTIRLGSGRATEHSLFVGAGPHLDLGTRLNVDQGLMDVLSGDRASVAGRDSFTVADRLQGQFAAAVTMGYRTAFPLGAAGYRGFVSADVNYLVGLHYEDVAVHRRVDTDQDGLVVSELVDGSAPLVVERRSAWSGRGRGLDLAGGMQAGRWGVELRGDNLMTHMVWRSPIDRVYSLDTPGRTNSLFTVGVLPRTARVRVSGLPDYRGSLRYRVGSRLSVLSELERHAGTAHVRGGVELRGAHVEVRGGCARVTGRLHPSVGISLPLGAGRWIDLAAFTTTWNVERERRVAMAASLRVPVSAFRARR